MTKVKGLRASEAGGDGKASSGGGGYLGKALDRKPGSKVHMCARCDSPVAIYGRLIPCHHAFSLQCAEEMGTTCYLCFQQIEGIERVDASKQPLYLCGVCGVSYKSKEELLERVQANGGKCCRGGEEKKMMRPTGAKYA
uniref:RING-type domain-containing protein n=1 Tax=Phaeocystis cordata TaxID=118079 RepID=A0A7S1HQG9_9EUKA|mmetsp:Transcript_2197/g.5140  ORF Transcript_2197/g.5140 Transcript_2197/m.5140 type:complete len:139 (+) Transcript_2197:216-632(+)